MCFVQYPVWKYAVQCIVLITPTIALVHQQMQGLWQRRKEVSTFFDPLKHPDLSPPRKWPFLAFLTRPFGKEATIVCDTPTSSNCPRLISSQTGVFLSMAGYWVTFIHICFFSADVRRTYVVHCQTVTLSDCHTGHVIWAFLLLSPYHNQSAYVCKCMCKTHIVA